MSQSHESSSADIANVKPPRFPDREFCVRDYLRQEEGGVITAGVGRAIAACAEAGGGTVRVPAGEWDSGPIHLKSRVRLHLDTGSVIRFSPRPADYLPVVFTRWEGVECYNYSPLIYARGCTDIALTGEGVLEGNGPAWWHWKKLQQEAARELYDAEAEGVPVDKRVFGTEQAALRPQFFQPIECRNVLVEDVTFRDGPQWTLHPVYCDNVIIRHVKVLTDVHGPNTDGLNPDSCRNVLVEHCHFSTGDDCIAINSGMNEDGWRVNRPCENILIRHCVMEHGHGAIVIGSGMSGDVRNVHVHDCACHGTGRGIRLKSMRGRGGCVEDIRFERMTMTGIAAEAVTIDMYYGATTVPPRSSTPPLFRRILVRDIQCDSAKHAVRLRGLVEQPLEDIRLENLDITAPTGITVDNVVGLTTVACNTHEPKPS